MTAASDPIVAQLNRLAAVAVKHAAEVHGIILSMSDESSEALLGGLCRAGFVIEDISEPPLGDAWATVGSPEQRAALLPPYVKVKARRI